MMTTGGNPTLLPTILGGQHESLHGLPSGKKYPHEGKPPELRSPVLIILKTDNFKSSETTRVKLHGRSLTRCNQAHT